MGAIDPHRAVVLAVDAGGTSTRCAVVRGDGTVIGRGRGGPANHILSGWEAAQTSLTDAVGEARQVAAVEAVDLVLVGSAGVGAAGEGAEPVEALLRSLVPGAAQVRAIGDMVVAFWGALPKPVGVVVTAGTGSVCFGRNERDEARQVGGWGHVMGDEGSAYDIAVHALRAMACAVDGRGAATALVDSLPAAVGAATPIDLARRLYGGPLSRDQIAALAVTVVATARQGDAIAREILAHAGNDLAAAAVAALQALDLGDVDATVSYSGAVFDAGNLVLEPFAAAIAGTCPEARLVAPLLPPLGGALRLGFETLGVPLDGLALERLRVALADA